MAYIYIHAGKLNKQNPVYALVLSLVFHAMTLDFFKIFDGHGMNNE